MAFDFHKDKQTYIKYQQENAEKFVIPFIEKVLPLKAGIRVMEIGCAEGGVLKAFLEKGCLGTGVELMEGRYKLAQQVLAEELKSGQAELINKNIYDVDIEKEMPEKFDLIVLKDVIEHIHDQEKVMIKLREFLKPGGYIFFGFPPWWMPYGGHQQIASNSLASKLPYYHLLPMPIYRALLKLLGEKAQTVENLAEIKETGITIERFERILKKSHFSIKARTFYLINPIYKYKFGLKARKQLAIIAAIPYFRNFLTSCMYYLVQKEGN